MRETNFGMCFYPFGSTSTLYISGLSFSKAIAIIILLGAGLWAVDSVPRPWAQASRTSTLAKAHYKISAYGTQLNTNAVVTSDDQIPCKINGQES